MHAGTASGTLKTSQMGYLLTEVVTYLPCITLPSQVQRLGAPVRLQRRQQHDSARAWILQRVLGLTARRGRAAVLPQPDRLGLWRLGR